MKPTVEQILAFEPCIVYNRNKIQGILDSVNTWKDFLLLETLPYEDKIWIAVKLLPKDLVSKWVEIIVTRAVTNYCKDSNIESWAEKWLSGEDRSYSSAIHAVYAAAYTATVHAAVSAAHAAVSAADVAACAAVAAATSNAYAHSAVNVAVVASYESAATERNQQLEDLINILGDFS